MKTWPLLVLAMAYAQVWEVRRLPEDVDRLPRLLDEVRRARRAPCASIDASTPIFVIPAAGSLAGGFGTFFRSDVTLVSHSPVEQDIVIFWFARDAVDDPPVYEATLPANGQVQNSIDFVANRLGLSGLGAILIVGVDGNGDPDFGSSIDGTSRIWTNQPGSSGTVSQLFPAVNPISLFLEDDAIAMGLRHDERFRTNVGIVNLDPFPYTFQVTITGETFSSEMSMTVAAGSLSQLPVPAGNYGMLSVVFKAPPDAPDVFWAAYGTSVDNVTGDSWASMASAIYPAETNIAGH